MAFSGIFLAVLLEWVCPIYFLVNRHSLAFVAGSVHYFFILHLAASFLTGVSLPHVLVKQYPHTTFASYLFFFIVAFFIPFLGLAGLLLAILPTLLKQKPSLFLPNWIHSEEDSLLGENGNIGASKSSIGPGPLIGIIQHVGDENKRLQALIATLSLDTQYALPLLKIALKDTDDNVRLLAYALIKRKENVLNEKINHSLLAVDAEAIDKRFLHLKILATHIWELSQLEAKSSAVDLLYNQAYDYAQKALVLRPTDLELSFLVGRILLQKRQWNDAEKAFEGAIKNGVYFKKIQPYLAEIAFYKHAYGEVKTYLTPLPFTYFYYPLDNMIRYWNKKKYGS